MHMRRNMPTQTRSRIGSGRLSITYLVPALLSVVVVLLFARTLGFGFYWDDYHHARPWSVQEVLGTFAGPFDPLRIEPPFFRPLLVVTFATEWQVWGTQPLGYRMTNLVLHGLATTCVYLVLRRLNLPVLAAVVGSLFFAVIPANATTAVWISQRSDAMAASFVLCGVLCVANFYRARQVRWLIGLNGLLLLAIGSKEHGIVLPFVAVGVWMVLHILARTSATEGDAAGRPVWMYWRAEMQRVWHVTTRLRRRDLVCIGAPSLMLVALYLLYRHLVLPTGVAGDQYHAASPLRAFVSAAYWTFKGVPWEVSGSLVPWLAAALIMAAVVDPRAASWWVVLGGLGWIAINCAPLAYLGRVEPRLLYLASIGYSIIVAGLTHILGGWVVHALRQRLRWQHAFAVGGVAVAIGFWGTTAIGFVQAQNQFHPFSDKVLAGDYDIYAGKDRDAYPALYRPFIEDKLHTAGRLP